MNRYRLASFSALVCTITGCFICSSFFQSPQILRAQDVDVPISLTMQVNALTQQVNVLTNQMSNIAQMVPSGGFSAYLSTSPTVGNGNRIVFDAEVFDDANAFANGVFTAPLNGVYQFNYNVHRIGPGGFDVQIRQNGNLVHWSAGSQAVSGVPTAVGTALIKLNAGDQVDLAINSGSGPIIVVGTSYFSRISGFKVY